MIIKSLSQSNVFPVLFGEKSNTNAKTWYLNIDYNENNRLIAAGGVA